MYAYRYRHLKKKKINGAVWLGGLLLAVIGILLQNKKSLGIPVISIGIPTVVDAATIVNDTMFNLIAAMSQSKAFDILGDSLKELNDGEKYELIRELLSPNLNAMFVTPKDIDESVKRLSYTISEGINIAFMGEGLPA